MATLRAILRRRGTASGLFQDNSKQRLVLPGVAAPRGNFLSTTSTAKNNILHYEWLQQPEDNPQHVVLFLHGLLGNGRNLKTMAKKVCESSHKPGLLMDLPGHGQSSRRPLTKNTTSFDTCIQDIQTTLRHAGISGNTQLTMVGHSWGGRLALQYAATIANANTNIHRVWLLDTVPGQANESVERVIGAVTELLATRQQPITDRKEVVQTLISDGIDAATAQWLGSSMRKVSNKQNNTETEWEFTFDLNAIQDLLPEFATQDFMGQLQQVVHEKVRVDLLRGGKNSAWTVSTIAALQKILHDGQLHVLPKAGHWVHVDDLDGLLEIMDVS